MNNDEPVSIFSWASRTRGGKSYWRLRAMAKRRQLEKCRVNCTIYGSRIAGKFRARAYLQDEDGESTYEARTSLASTNRTGDSKYHTIDEIDQYRRGRSSEVLAYLATRVYTTIRKLTRSRYDRDLGCIPTAAITKRTRKQRPAPTAEGTAQSRFLPSVSLVPVIY